MDIPILGSEFTPVKARSHTPPYKIHRYFARRPWNLFQGLVDHFSEPHDIVLDPFCGGGVTVYEALNSNRRVVACDLNPLSTYIIRNMFHRPLPNSVYQAISEVDQYLEELVTYSFLVSCPDCGEKTMAVWYELAQLVECVICGAPTILTNDRKIRNGHYKCTNQDCVASRKGFMVAHAKRRDPVYLSIHGKCPRCNTRFHIKVDNELQEKNRRHVDWLRKQVDNAKANLPDEKIPTNWDRQHEDLLFEKGIVNFQDLFTRKSLYINYLLLHKIKSYQDAKETYEILRFLFSDSLRETNIMTFTNEKWQNGTPNSWAKHAYWTPAEFCEVNAHKAYEKSLKSLKDSINFNNKQEFHFDPAGSFIELSKGSKTIYFRTGTVEDLNLPSGTIDVIITDPPYGSNVQYLELSHFWYMWNKDLYDVSKLDSDKEAVVNRKNNLTNRKTYKSYEDNLFHVFRECHRVLKKDGLMVMTFNNKDIRAWLALLISVFKSGFHFDKGGITFQDGITNYRHTAHTKAKGSPYGDFVYKFTRQDAVSSGDVNSIDTNALIKHIESRLENAIQEYRKNNMDRNMVLLALFNEIVPGIELFVKCSESKNNSNELYETFTKRFLEPLYA